MNTVSGDMSSKSLIGQAVAYANVLLPRLSRYVLDGRYHINNNGIENAIRPLALGRLCGVQHNLPYVGNEVMLASYAFWKELKEMGINVNDPKFGRWVEHSIHNKTWKKYNDDFGQYLRTHSDASVDDLVIRKIWLDHICLMDNPSYEKLNPLN